ncbi:S9 family peptidase [Litorilinea aerophila]|uniref:S9 family peptidase n=1 Tax=Litorilinea aerophila TaxID=1204385 RepID=A0A540VIP2_9CHLR|nr:S9 family peptidase [Litorilinea aerophila]MCC9075859.1 S9 family peptidase [Litorilinea aerophila]
MADFVWTPQALIHYPLIEHVDLSPDGRRVLFTGRTAHLTDSASEFRPQIFLASLDDGQVRPLTVGEGAGQPRWNPDGRHLAFLRKVPDTGQAGLWVMAADGGEAWPLTGAANQIRNPVTRFKWSPDGTRLAFLTVPWDADQEARRQRKEDVRRWREEYDFAHLFVIDFRELAAGTGVGLPAARQLTQGRFTVLDFCWHPDGHTLAFTHRPAPLYDTWPATRLATVPADGSAPPTDLAPIASQQAEPFFSPDGRWIACAVGDDPQGSWPYASHVHLFAADGSDSRPLAPVPDAMPLVMGWAPDGRAVYAINQHGIDTQVMALPVDGSPAQVCLDPSKHVAAWHINQAGLAALVMDDFHEPNSVYVAELAGAHEGRWQRVAQPTAPAFPDNGPLPQVELLHWTTPDGYRIEGILYLPANYDRERDGRLPLLLHVHGGPASVFQRQFAAQPYYYTPAALCERGIAVLRCNPRGSGGYGQEFRFANRRDWGGGDYRDLQQGVDRVIEMGIGDPARLGICGWSYGGFMTSWTITQTDRFKAASIGAAVTNLVSFNGTSDIPSLVPGYFDAEFWEERELYLAHSPIFHVHQVRTPAIIQHGDADERVPLEQGLQFYNGLARRGVPVTLYIYPRQGHAISEPRLLADAIQRNLDWFSEMLTSA